MSNDDLLRMLDLEGKEAPPTNEPLPITAAGVGAKSTPASPTVLCLDDWGLRRGEDVLRESERLQECLAGVDGWEEQEPGREGGAGHDFGAEIAVLKHVSKALSEASKEVEEAKEAAAALGLGPGAPGSNDPRAIAALFKRVRSDPTLRRICELAGRYRRVAQSRQRRKATHGLDDVVGVVPDADLGRLLPSELAKLALPEFA